MPVCRKCKKEWPVGMTACPNDGWSFTLEVDATYHPPVTGSGAAVAVAVAHAPAEDEPPPSTDLVAGAIVGEYRVEKKIGEGGMGAVYSAMHPLIGKRAAIKVISSALGTDASAVNRFVQEARSVNQIGHPNIVDVFAFGELPDGRNYFVMEYLQGESLAERIERTAMPLGDAIEILDQVADALEAAHEKQIVHRDLKPDNVYLAAVRGGRTMVKLLDFGIAKLSAPEGGVQKTRTGMMMGTPGYLSPEQARGKNVDHRTDVYALGCMVFEIVCGRLPFVADNAMDIVLMHMTAPPPRASEIWPDIPPPLDELLARMLEKEAEARPSLPEVRAVFAELVTSGLVTLNSGRGVAFGSGISRLQTGQTPMPGAQVRPTGMIAVGTQPATQAPGTTPPGLSAAAVTPPPRSKTGLVAGVLAAVVLVGGAGAFFAMQGGDAPAAPTPAPVAAAVATPPPPEPVKPPEPVTPVEKPVDKTVEPPKLGGLEVTLNVDGASVNVDGTPIAVTGKKATAKDLAVGPHTLAITAAGREPVEQEFEVTAGMVVASSIKLERARAGGKKPVVAAGKPPVVTAGKPPPPGAGSGSAKPVEKPATFTSPDGTVDPFQ